MGFEERFKAGLQYAMGGTIGYLGALLSVGVVLALAYGVFKLLS